MNSYTNKVFVFEEADVAQSPYASVADFYAGKSIFITGVSGFLGKMLLEKLLYSCKDIDKVYVLIRDKKGVNSLERVQEFITKPLFWRLKRDRPEDLKKIIPVPGDINKFELGISTEDQETLIEKVSVVFHIAATVKFNEKLKSAVGQNVIGTKYVLNLCHQMKNIKAFVHISTAYCHIDKDQIEEKAYPPPADLGEVLKFLDQSRYDDEQVKTLLGGLPNTYTFTKALAETYVAENHGNMPTVIIRPSIVTSSYKEPLPGWVDNWYGATGLVTATMSGVNRVLLGRGDNILDIIPVDYVTNLTIVAAARCARTDNVTVYNSCTSSCNPITIRNLFNSLKKNAPKCGFGNSQISLTITESKVTLSLLTFLLQTTPAFMMDLFLRMKGKKPQYMKIQSRVLQGRTILNYFTSNSWEMKTDRARALYASLSPEDRQRYPCNPTDINWDDYTKVYLEGISTFLMRKTV